MAMKIRIGSRGSQLALWQTNWVKGRLFETYPQVECDVQIIQTKGDMILDKTLAQLGKGSFTKELDRALLDGEIDLAVHSLKDLPTDVPEGLILSAISERANCLDAFISPTHTPLADLPQGAVVATGSLRRRAFLLHHRPDLEVVDVRGNVDTRLAKLKKSDWQGMVLASAGLERLALTEVITHVLDQKVMLPAVGQGFLGVICRADDHDVQEALQGSIHHEPSGKAARAERSFLNTLEGGCQIPIGSWARWEGDHLCIDGAVSDLDGKVMVKSKLQGDGQDPEKMGRDLADKILQQGGQEILANIRAVLKGN